MEQSIGHNARKTNPALQPFTKLIGEWQTTGTHPYFPDVTLKGRTVFEWHENGAFVIARSEIDHPKFPDGIQIFGSDDAAGTYFMLHFDERGTSRKYNVEVMGEEFIWNRDDPEFSQYFTLTVKEDGQHMESQGKMSQKGQPWEDDLSLTFTRVA
jgi:hypothetical protein